MACMFSVGASVLQAEAQTVSAYVMAAGSNSITLIGSNNSGLGSFQAQGYPTTAALSPDRTRLYVACAQSNSVLVLNASTGSPIGSISGVGPGPAVVALTPDGGHLYVTLSPLTFNEQGQGGVAVIDTNTFAVTYISQGLGTNPFGIAVSPDGTQVWVVSDSDGKVSVISTSTNSVVNGFAIPAQYSPQNVAFKPDGSQAYITMEGNNSLAVVSTTNFNNGSTVQVGSAPHGVAVSADGRYVLVTDLGSVGPTPGASSLAIVDTQNNFAVSYAGTGNEPTWVDFSADGTRAYVTNQADGTVSIYDATNAFASLGTVSVGQTPLGVVARPPVTPTSSPLRPQYSLYVGNASSMSNSISVVNTSTDTVLPPLAVGYAPSVVLASPDGTRVYAFSSASSNISVIDTATGSQLGSIPWSYGAPVSAAISPDGTQIYAVEQTTPPATNSAVAFVNTTTFTLTSTYLGRYISSVAFSPDGTRAYLGASDGFTVVDTSTQTFIASYTTGFWAQFEAVTVDGADLIAVNNIGALQLFDTTAFNPLGASLTVPNCSYPSSLAATLDGSRVYLGCNNEVASVSLTGGTPTLLGTTSIGGTNIAVTPNGGQVYASSGSLYDLLVMSGGLSSNPTAPIPVSSGAAGLAIADPLDHQTAAGANVTTQLPTPGGTVSVTFASVSTAGTTVATRISPAQAGTLPGGFAASNFAWDVTTTAIYSSPLTVCFTLPTITDPTAFASLQVFHFENGNFVNETITSGPNAPNFSTHTICAQTYSLSPFVIAQPAFATTTQIQAPAAVTYGSPVNVTVSVNSASGTVTGNVSLSVNGQTPILQALSGGSSNFDLGTLPAGSYNLSASFNTQGNFSSGSAVGSLGVSPAPLTITANAASSVYGTAQGPFSASYIGFVNNDTVSALSGTLSCTSAATSTSAVGSYAINCSGQSSPNYSIAYASGTLTITPAPTHTTINASATTYGMSASVTVSVSPTTAGNVSLSVNGGTPMVQALSSGASTFNVNGLAAGTYSLSASFAAQGNFAASSITGSLVVNPAPLTVTANAASSTYGSTPGPFSANYSGFVNGDSAGSLSGTLSCSTTATASSPAGTYPINCGGVSSPNYAITFNPGTLTVNPAPLIVTANNASKVLDAPNPAFTAVYSGFVLGQNAGALGGTLSCTTTASTTSPVGNYPINCSGQTSSNYAITYKPGTLSIQYASGGLCDGAGGHQILPPIDPLGSSVFTQGRTIPAQFRVCDANGVSIGNAGVVSSFYLTTVMNGTASMTVQDVVDTNNPDLAFRFDSTSQAWIFNISTSNLAAGYTYVYAISLNDGTTMVFQYGLR